VRTKQTGKSGGSFSIERRGEKKGGKVKGRTQDLQGAKTKEKGVIARVT